MFWGSNLRLTYLVFIDKSNEDLTLALISEFAKGWQVDAMSMPELTA
jgi:hypothetical protein